MSQTVIDYDAPVSLCIGDPVYGLYEAEHRDLNGARIRHYVVRRYAICGISAETETESWAAAKRAPEVRFTAFRRYGRSAPAFTRISFLPHQIDPVAVRNEHSVFTSYNRACILSEELNAAQDARARDAGVSLEWKESNDKEVRA
jgi:hypothetical protein